MVSVKFKPLGNAELTPKNRICKSPINIDWRTKDKKHCLNDALYYHRIYLLLNSNQGNVYVLITSTHVIIKKRTQVISIANAAPSIPKRFTNQNKIKRFRMPQQIVIVESYLVLFL